jgi:hypothetical protein
VDELYDGPFCVLSAVDNRSFRRLAYEVLDAGHSPTQQDVRTFLGRLKAELDRRGLGVRGVTTDGSELYPAPLAEVFAGVPHQVCRFHALKAITKGVLAAVGKVRGELARRVPKLSRGRTARHDKARRAATRKAKRLRRRIADLYEHRHLFVRRGPSPSQSRTLRRITRGLPHLRSLREIMDEVYRLFDRRCRAETALQKLAALRRRARRFKKLGRAWTGSAPPRWRRRWRSWTTSCCRPRVTRWSGATAATARCRRPCTASARASTSASASPLTCYAR